MPFYTLLYLATSFTEGGDTLKFKPKIQDGKSKKLADNPACADDISQYCHEVDKENNFAILICLQDKAKVNYLTDIVEKWVFSNGAMMLLYRCKSGIIIRNDSNILILSQGNIHTVVSYNLGDYNVPFWSFMLKYCWRLSKIIVEDMTLTY